MEDNSIQHHDMVRRLEVAEAGLKDESSKLSNAIRKLEAAEAQIRQLEANIPVAVTAAVVAAVHDPGVLQQLVYAIGEFQVTLN